MNTPTQTTILPPHYGTSISLARAKKMMEAAEKQAEKNQWPMVIAIVDTGGHLVMLHRMEQAQLASVKIARLKAETAVSFKRPTKAFEDIIANGGMGLRLLSAPDMIAMEGGLPILHEGQVIGAIGVSGMQSPQDAEIARAGLAALS